MEGIEKLMQEGLNRRGMDSIGQAVQGNLRKAVQILRQADTVAIATGFPIKGTGRGETDGITGSLALAEVLTAADKEVVLVSDAINYPLLQAGLDDHLAIPVLSREDWLAMDWENKQGVFVAIERPGKSADGSMYSMRGECLDGEVEEFDSLLEWAKFRKLPTLAIGDGGNELGLGQYKKLIGKCVDQGERIAAQIAADLVLVAGTSNWGAHGICAGLKAGAKPEEEKKREADRLKKIVAAGAIDGATKRREESVDGYDRTAYLEQVGRIYGK